MTDYPPPGITQAEWHELTPAERAALISDDDKEFPLCVCELGSAIT
ncbi:hypothetical protein [Streptomyces sp. NPDC005231]